MATDFSDQLTGASINILSLQCWAGAVSEALVIVEPFVSRGSHFGVTLSTLRSGQKVKEPEEDINKLRLRDVLNLKSWEEQIRGRDYALMKSWETFRETAPKNLIVVGKACVKHKNKLCNINFYRSISLFAKEHRFNIVRSIQVTFEIYSFSIFRDIIYGGHKPNQSVMVFHHWGGIVEKPGNYRIAMSRLAPCTQGLLINFL